MNGNIIKFLRQKDFRFIKELGQGGTGRTVLLEDETINIRFVCKKYSPLNPDHQNQFFENFKEEIKLLHLLYNENVVRIFNYYLYPNEFTGYILMEHIDGESIDKYITRKPNKVNDLFRQSISGFRYLEEANVLHRDIRPENILVSEKGFVKIIDLGFGKHVKIESDYQKSISLNWRYETPSEFVNGKYDGRTEVYFVGKLFEEIINENELIDFQHLGLLKQMIDPNYDSRISSFFNVQRRLISQDAIESEFSDEEKAIYQAFASRLQSIFSRLDEDAEYISDINLIVKRLSDLYQNSILEETLQNEVMLARCFIKGRFQYKKHNNIYINTINEFLKFLRTQSVVKQRIVINNIWQRLDSIGRFSKEIDDLPF